MPLSHGRKNCFVSEALTMGVKGLFFSLAPAWWVCGRDTLAQQSIGRVGCVRIFMVLLRPALPFTCKRILRDCEGVA